MLLAIPHLIEGQAAFMKNLIKRRLSTDKTAIISALNCPCGQEIHSLSGGRWSSTQKLMRWLGELPNPKGNPQIA